MVIFYCPSCGKQIYESGSCPKCGAWVQVESTRWWDDPKLRKIAIRFFLGLLIAAVLVAAVLIFGSSPGDRRTKDKSPDIKIPTPKKIIELEVPPKPKQF